MSYPDLIELVRDARDEWEGWDWTHDPGGLVIEGPGKLTKRQWDQWERQRCDEIDVTDLHHLGLVGTSEYPTDQEVYDLACDIAAAERAYGERVQYDAARARSYGSDAIAALKEGDLLDAEYFVIQASNLEHNYGDNPAWSPVLKAIRDAIDEEWSRE